MELYDTMTGEWECTSVGDNHNIMGEIMEKNIQEENKKEGKGNDRQQKGFFNRFLKWISRGTEKAGRNGSFCNT